MKEKLLTSQLFKGKKETYPASVAIPFKADRLSENDLFKNFSKQKKDAIASKKFFKDQNEKIMV